AILTALTTQAIPGFGNLPGYSECLNDGGSPEVVEIQINDTEGPFSDGPKFKVICNYPVSSRCADGTMQGECSETKPFLCYSTKGLVERCDKCGCPDGQVCEDRTCLTTTSTSTTSSSTTTSVTVTSSTTSSSTSSSSTTTTVFAYTTSSTIPETTSTTITEEPPGITGRFASTRGTGTLMAGVLVLIIGYALVKVNPSSGEKRP
ncbi:MAG: hypothetical protein ABH834_02075, partial [Candidatus Altiarchaeota archaeon]